MGLIKRFILTVLVVAPVAASAKLDIAATSTSMAMLARTVGGDQVDVATLAPPDRDIHTLSAKPGMIRTLRGADLLMAVGADLEVGWLPAALRSSANPGIQPGTPGYFEAAAQVSLRDTDQAADRAKGHVHPAGNPHLQLDPIRMAEVAEALAARLGELAPQSEAAFRANAEAFTERANRRTTEWRQAVQQAPAVVLYHKDMDYLLARLGLEAAGYVEPMPGVPPTARHVRELVQRLQGRDGIILSKPYDPVSGVERLSAELGWPSITLPIDPPLGADAEAYFQLIQRYVSALSGAGG